MTLTSFEDVVWPMPKVNTTTNETIDYPCSIDTIDRAATDYEGGQCQFAADHCDPESP